jgi:hypothetical protein
MGLESLAGGARGLRPGRKCRWRRVRRALVSTSKPWLALSSWKTKAPCPLNKAFCDAQFMVRPFNGHIILSVLTIEVNERLIR